MSDYDYDPRVRRISDYQFEVAGYEVYGRASDQWYTVPCAEGPADPYAGQPRDLAFIEAWVDRERQGPFPSRDAAFASLIGSPDL